MDLVDVCLVACIGWAAFRGWRRGLVQSLVSLAGLVLAYGFALTYGGSVAGWLGADAADSGAGVYLVGFVVVFLATIIGFYIGGRILHKILHTSPLGIVDTIGGVTAGVAKSLLVLGLLMILIRSLPLPGSLPAAFDSSMLGRPVERSSLLLLDGIKAAFPSAARLYRKIVPGAPDDPAHPIVDEAGDKAEKVRRSLDAMIEESRDRLESK